jgi:hypothetical protein
MASNLEAESRVLKQAYFTPLEVLSQETEE